MISKLSSFKRNIPILAICQALFMSGTSLMVATTALVGYALADNKIYASLPFTLQLVATMFTSIPAGKLMGKIGSKKSFLYGTVLAMFGAAICAYGVVQDSFILFTLGSVFIGVFSGFANSNIQQHVELFAATRVPVPTKYEYDQEEYENENQYQFPTQNHMQKQRPEAVLCHFHREDYKNL